MEKDEWKPFRSGLDKSDRKRFDEMMFDIPRFYISAYSNSVQYVRLYPILMSILLYNYKELTECVSEVEGIEAKVKGSLQQTTVEDEVELLSPSPPRQLKLSEF
jgi:hypothetical protein